MANAEDSLLEQVAALKHDLGKYVAWMSVNLDESAWTGPVGDGLLAALRSDVLATKKGSDGARAAWEVWAAHTKEMPRPLEPVELREVEAAVEVLRLAGPALRDGDRDAIAGRREAIRAAQLSIRSLLSAAHRTLLRGEGGS